VIPRWVTRIFDDRYAWLRMTLLGLSGIGYLIARDEPADPFAPIDWVFAVAAIALCPVPVWWPLAGSVASSVVFAAASWFGQAEPIVPQVGATWVLVELALRAPPGANWPPERRRWWWRALSTTRRTNWQAGPSTS
jgi:hypothetical protein